MSQPTGKRNLSLNQIVTLVICGTIGGFVLLTEPGAHPDLHTGLDTGMFLLSGVLALLFWDMSRRPFQLFPRLIAISFAVTSVLEILHAFTGVERSGLLVSINGAAVVLRPTTWPLAAYLLPFGIGWSLWLRRRQAKSSLGFAVVLTILSLALLEGFRWFPGYTEPRWWGITRPTLVLAPLLWAVIGIVSLKMRNEERLLAPLTLMAGVLFVANGLMLYSAAPHDNVAMVAHLGKVCGYLLMLLSVMQLASSDMRQRIRTEQELAQLNQDLERRVVDRTTRLESANQFLETEVALRGQIFNTALDAIVTMDHKGLIVEFNPAAERIFGYRRSEVIGLPLADVIVPPEWREQHRRGLARYLETSVETVLGKRIEIRGMRADSSSVPVELSISRMQVDGPPMFAGFLRDITERKQAETELAYERDLLRTLLDNFPDLIYFKDLESRFVRVSKTKLESAFTFCLARHRASHPDGNGETLPGYLTNLEEFAEYLRGKSDFDFFKEDDARSVQKQEQEIIRTGKPLIGKLDRVTRSDGQNSWYLSTKMPWRDTHGMIIGTFGTSKDVTLLKETEDAQRESEDRFRTLAETLPQLVWTCKPDGYCDYLSPQWVEYTGRAAEEQLGSGWAEHLHPDDRERVQVAWSEATARGDNFDVEFRIRRSDGVYRWFKTRAVPLRDASGNITKWFGSNTDFEDYKRAEQKLQSQLDHTNY